MPARRPCGGGSGSADFLIETCPYTAPFARLGKVRSAGVRDLGHGYLRDQDWQAVSGRQRAAPAALPLPPGVRCHAMAASLQQRPGKPGAPLRGDGLVPVDSALGRSSDAAGDLGLPDERRWIGYAMGHFDLLARADAYARIRSWLDDRRASLFVQPLEPGAPAKDILAGSQLFASSGFGGQMGSGITMVVQLDRQTGRQPARYCV